MGTDGDDHEPTDNIAFDLEEFWAKKIAITMTYKKYSQLARRIHRKKS